MTAVPGEGAGAAPVPPGMRVFSRAGVRAALIRTSGLTALMYLLSVGRDVLLAGYYGGSPALDILFIATAPSQFLGLEIATLTYLALLPEFVGAAHRGGTDIGGLLRRRVTFAGLIGLLVGGALAVAGALVPEFFAPGFAHRGGLSLVQWSIAVCSALVPIFAVAGTLRAMLESQGRFSPWAVYPGLRSVALVICAVAGAASRGIGWLLAGTLIGTLAGPLYFAGLAGLHRFDRAAGSDAPAVSATVPKALPALAGSLLLGAVTVSIDNAFASATGLGGVQALTIATNLLLVPQALIGGVVATVFFPVYASHWAQGDRTMALRALRRSARLVALGLLPFVILFCSPLGTMVARLVYRHGTFDESLTVLVGQTAAALALGQVGYAIFVLFKQFMLVVAAPVTLLEASAVYLVAKWVGNRALVGPLGLPGIALASSIASALACTYLLLRLWGLRRSWQRAAT